MLINRREVLKAGALVPLGGLGFIDILNGKEKKEKEKEGFASVYFGDDSINCITEAISSEHFKEVSSSYVKAAWHYSDYQLNSHHTLNGFYEVLDVGKIKSIPTYSMMCSVDWDIKHTKENRFDVMKRARRFLLSSFKQRIKNDAWSCVLCAAIDTDIVLDCFGLMDLLRSNAKQTVFIHPYSDLIFNQPSSWFKEFNIKIEYDMDKYEDSYRNECQQDLPEGKHLVISVPTNNIDNYSESFRNGNILEQSGGIIRQQGGPHLYEDSRCLKERGGLCIIWEVSIGCFNKGIKLAII